MRRKHPDGLTAAERAMYARLKKGPAALSSLAHAARCARGAVKVHISRLRKKLPCGTVIPRSFFGAYTYHLEVSKTAALPATARGCKTETGAESAKAGTKGRPGKLGNGNSNNMLCVAEVLPYYTLCELTLRPLNWIKSLARATMLRSWYNSGAKWVTV